jgi:S-adenosylmethionine hydrolase
MRIITLTTDFGTRDPYVGTMRGVIFTIASDARVVDLTHEIAKQQITEGALVLQACRDYFPSGTIHLAVVDPGVGGPRRPVVIESRRQFFIGPDNGIFSYVLDDSARGFELRNPSFQLSDPSDTFHGRDIFAPAAAHLSLGVEPARFGPEVRDFVRLEARKPVVYANTVRGEVIHVDSFGNLITNVSRELVDGVGRGLPCVLEVSGRRIEGILRRYVDAAPGRLLALVGSAGLVEIAVRDGSARRKLGVGVGDPVVLTFGA